jgi:hypothetical protein
MNTPQPAVPIERHELFMVFIEGEGYSLIKADTVGFEWRPDHPTVQSKGIELECIEGALIAPSGTEYRALRHRCTKNCRRGVDFSRMMSEELS